MLRRAKNAINAPLLPKQMAISLLLNSQLSLDGLVTGLVITFMLLA